MTRVRTKQPPTERREIAGAAPQPAEGALRALLRAFGLLRRCNEPYFARFGISGAQWGVLRVLARAEEEGAAWLRLTDIGRRLLIRPPSVTAVVDRLHKQGLLARTTSPADQRAKRVSLTPAGRALMGRVLEGHARRTRSLFGCLSEAEQRELHRLLDRLATHLARTADGCDQDEAGPGPRGDDR